MWTFPCSQIDELLDVACDDPDAAACVRLAAVLRKMAARVQREIAGSAQEPTAETQDLLHELQRAVRNIADLRRVPLAWSRPASAREIDNQQVLRVLAGLVEALDSLARWPEPSAVTKANEAEHSNPTLNTGVARW
jgi:hypothetical protein